jgi:rhodanese-related sulfurtransferase
MKPTLKHLPPQGAWALLQTVSSARLIDIRMEVEFLYVGRPPKAINIPWYEYPDFEADAADFAAKVQQEVTSKDQIVILICRSGSRTLDAGAALIDAGFTHVINVVNGFEGDLDTNDHRSTLNGWRFDGLPWEQM